jgi:hypothetical protein
VTNGPESENIRKALAILKGANFDFNKDNLFGPNGGTNGVNINSASFEPLIDIEGVLDEVKPSDKGKVADETLEELEK